MDNNKSFRDRESGRVVGGIILVSVGAALLLRNMGFFMPAWLFSWPMILILIGMYIGFKSSFRNNGWFVLTAVGGYFLVSKFIPELGLTPLFWPLMIILLGVAFILKPGRNRWPGVKSVEGYNKWDSVPVDADQDPVNVSYPETSDYLVIDSVFSGVNKFVVSKDFKGGRITSVFGGSKIDFTQADINGAVVIKLDIVFGGTKLVIPPHWTIQNELKGAFHGIDDKRKFNPSAVNNPDKVLILRGSVVFGGIEIASY